MTVMKLFLLSSESLWDSFWEDIEILSVHDADIELKNKRKFSQWWCHLVSSQLPSLQLLVNSEDAGASLVVLPDQETTEVLFVELLKPHTHIGTHTTSISFQSTVEK